MSNSVFVITTITAIDGKADKLALLLQQIVETSQREKGCLKYDLLMNAHDESEFVFLEEWKAERRLMNMARLLISSLLAGNGQALSQISQ